MVWFTLILMIVDEIRMVDDAMKDEWNLFACCFIPGSNQTCSPQLVGPPICLLLLLHPIDNSELWVACHLERPRDSSLSAVAIDLHVNYTMDRDVKSVIFIKLRFSFGSREISFHLSIPNHYYLTDESNY